MPKMLLDEKVYVRDVVKSICSVGSVFVMFLAIIQHFTYPFYIVHPFFLILFSIFFVGFALMAYMKE